MNMSPATITRGSSGQRRRTYPTLLTKPRSSDFSGECVVEVALAAVGSHWLVVSDPRVDEQVEHVG